VRAEGVAVDLPPPPELAAVVALALAEDLTARGDATAAATVPAGAAFAGTFASREAGVVAGTEVIAATYAAVDSAVEVVVHLGDGAAVRPGDAIAEVRGPARSVLTGERTALNLLGHLCGVATATRRYADAVAGTGAVVRDTRKTLPGLRALQKAAVAAGGGVNHRLSLSDGILVKDNHVAAAGGVGAATRAALAHAGDLPVQVEVDDLDELAEALEAGARAILLDNFDLDGLAIAVDRCRARGTDVFVEASGGVTLDTVAAIARAGVDAIAVGALTHSVRALDIGLDLTVQER
jgi:nicotinate-nucleotide pyrophosphorylase (carboxylating)